MSRFRKRYLHSPAWSDACAYGDGQCDGIVPDDELYGGEECGCGCHDLPYDRSPQTVKAMTEWHENERRLYGPV